MDKKTQKAKKEKNVRFTVVNEITKNIIIFKYLRKSIRKIIKQFNCYARKLA